MTPSGRTLSLGCACLALGLLVGKLLPDGWIVGSAGSLWETKPKIDEPVAQARLPGFSALIDHVADGVVRIVTERDDGAIPAAIEDVPATPAVGATGHTSTSLVLKDQGIVRGTGFLIHRDGYVVTNYHAISGFRRISVHLAGHRQSEAEVLAWDVLSDIALLRLKTRWKDLKALPLGDSEKVRQSDWVLVLGNPLDYGLTAAPGIVSFVGRHLEDRVTKVSNPYLQFTAPVFAGNSGGPLFDLEGNVIGVIARVSTQGQGISFAVPSHVLKRVLERFKTNGKVDRGWIGMHFCPVDRDLAGAHVGEGSEAVKVLRLVEGSPAEAAGVLPEDLVLSFDGRPVKDAQSLYDWITETPPGRKVPIRVLRNLGGGVNREVQVSVVVASARNLLPGFGRVN